MPSTDVEMHAQAESETATANMNLLLNRIDFPLGNEHTSVMY